MSTDANSIPLDQTETPLQAAQRRLIAIVGLDTNALRAAGLNLAHAWFEKMLNASHDAGATVLVPSIAFEEWFKFHRERLSQSRSKAQSALRDLAYFEVPERVVETIEEPKDENTRARLIAMLQERSIVIVPDAPGSMEQYLKEAVQKEPPFEAGGKGFVDAVIIDSIIAYAVQHAAGSRILLVSNDTAVARSGARFERNGLDATVVPKDGAYDAIVNSQDEKTKAFIHQRDALLLEHVRKFEKHIIAAAREQPLSPSFLVLKTFKSKNSFSAETPIHIVGLRPRSVDSVTAYQGIPEFIAGENRYRVSVGVNCDIDLVFRSYYDIGSLFGLGAMGPNRTPSTVGKEAPLPMPAGSMLSAPREWEETHEVTIFVEGSIDRKQYDEGIASGFQLEHELTDEQRVAMSEYFEKHKKI